MGIYLCYDVKGIQSYIFKIPKLKYIIGGSALIDQFDKETVKNLSVFSRYFMKISIYFLAFLFSRKLWSSSRSSESFSRMAGSFKYFTMISQHRITTDAMNWSSFSLAASNR
ncbi:MAG: hypothetical protein U9P10_12985 [Thermodesulfobacteriota bacterium]|nr:hypothetical protein [Thermodesulfobacteriota bacterium]